MTVAELKQQLDLELVSGSEGLHKSITGVYIGDMLSWVMAKAEENHAWITIQTNLNVLAVALMTEVSCIIIAENAEIPEETTTRSDDENIPILRSPMTAYELAVTLAGVMNHE